MRCADGHLLVSAQREKVESKKPEKIEKGEMFVFKKRSLRVILVVAIVIGLFALTGCGSAPATTTTGSSSGSSSGSSTPTPPTPPPADKVLKVGSDITYAPFEFMDQNQKPIGFDIDLLDAIAKDMGYTTKYETSPFDGLILSLASKKYDAVISAMTITEERSKSVLFSDKYFLATQYIAVKKGSPIKSAADLKGKRVGVQTDTTGQFAMDKMGVTTKKYDTTPDALTDLVNGGLDAVVADSPVVLYFINKNPNANVQALSGDFPKEYYGIAMNKDNTELAGKLNASLKKLIDNGEYAKIYKKWFNADPPSLN